MCIRDSLNVICINITSLKYASRCRWHMACSAAPKHLSNLLCSSWHKAMYLYHSWESYLQRWHRRSYRHLILHFYTASALLAMRPLYYLWPCPPSVRPSVRFSLYTSVTAAGDGRNSSDSEKDNKHVQCILWKCRVIEQADVYGQNGK